MAGDGWGYPLPWTEGRRRPLVGPPKQWRTRYELEVGVATEKGQRTRKVSAKGRPAVLKALEQRLVRAIPLVRAVVVPLSGGGGGATAAADHARDIEVGGGGRSAASEEEEEEEEEAKMHVMVSYTFHQE